MNKFAYKDAIIICRISKFGDTKSVSLDSQEHEIKKFVTKNNIKIYTTFKTVGSAFKKPQNELKSLLRSCKNKNIIVYEPSRLTRNTDNFYSICSICKRQKHVITVLNLNRTFWIENPSNLSDLSKYIKIAENESIELGKRISRSIQYKKSKELEWGYSLDDKGYKIINDREVKTSKLIKLLSTAKSSITEIKNLISELSTNKDIEPFEIVEYTDSSKTRYNILKTDFLPDAMTYQNIVETFNIYGIYKRNNKWKTIDISNILNNNKASNITDNFCDDLLNLNINKTSKKVETLVVEPLKEWISIYYDPKIGLPSDIKLPDGMELPTIPILLYIPKL